MSTELVVQSERAFQRQKLFLNSKASRTVTRDRRWYKDVGLGFKTPRGAIDGDYIGEQREGQRARWGQVRGEWRVGGGAGWAWRRERVSL
jgi:hypothetical protein